MDIDKLRRELDAWSTDDIVPGDLAALCAEASAALARLHAVRDFNSHPNAPDPDSAVHRAMVLKLEAAEAELAHEAERYQQEHGRRIGLEQQLSTARALLREAGEVMEDIDFIARTTSGLGYEVIHRYARAFTAKLSPAPEPVREDTYPDRVSMEPWPHIGHAPGGKRAGD